MVVVVAVVVDRVVDRERASCRRHTTVSRTLIYCTVLIRVEHALQLFVALWLEWFRLDNTRRSLLHLMSVSETAQHIIPPQQQCPLVLMLLRGCVVNRDVVCRSLVSSSHGIIVYLRPIVLAQIWSLVTLFVCCNRVSVLL